MKRLTLILLLSFFKTSDRNWKSILYNYNLNSNRRWKMNFTPSSSYTLIIAFSNHKMSQNLLRCLIFKTQHPHNCSTETTITTARIIWHSCHFNQWEKFFKLKLCKLCIFGKWDKMWAEKLLFSSHLIKYDYDIKSKIRMYSTTKCRFPWREKQIILN